MTSSAVNLEGGREGGKEKGGREHNIVIKHLTRPHSPIHVVR